jgi:hypothetical protein
MKNVKCPISKRALEFNKLLFGEKSEKVLAREKIFTQIKRGRIK